MEDQYISGLKQIVGIDSVRTDDESLKTYGKDWLNDYQPAPTAILFPNSYAQVSEILRFCNKNKLPIVPSGGRTGLSGGAAATSGEFVLSLTKLNKISAVNETDRTVTCQAGVITQTLIDKVKEHNLFFPIDFASKGSSQIGGNIATNAGGIRVVRWGILREWVRGLKVVLASGELLELNGSLVKNQTGYDLRSLFIGSEGTLGVIVEATLKLTSLPEDPIRLLCALDDNNKVLPLFNNCQKAFQAINAFEYFTDHALDLVVKHNNFAKPFVDNHPVFILLELEPKLCGGIENIHQKFGEFLEAGLIKDIVISQSTQQADALLAYRERISETVSAHYTYHKNDVSVAPSKIPEFLSTLEQCIATEYPGYRAINFGHVGDGNIHVNLIKPDNLSNQDFHKHCKEADKKIFTLIHSLSGSISAEHGVGLLKRDFLQFSRTKAEIQLMREIKKVFDPNGIMNPNKIFNLQD